MDSERRSMFDDYGTTSEPRHGGPSGFQRESRYRDFFFDEAFDSFFGGGGGGGGGGGFKNRSIGLLTWCENSRKNPEDEINKKYANIEKTVFELICLIA